MHISYFQYVIVQSKYYERKAYRDSKTRNKTKKKHLTNNIYIKKKTKLNAKRAMIKSCSYMSTT